MTAASAEVEAAAPPSRRAAEEEGEDSSQSWMSESKSTFDRSGAGAGERRGAVGGETGGNRCRWQVTDSGPHGACPAGSAPSRTEVLREIEVRDV